MTRQMKFAVTPAMRKRHAEWVQEASDFLWAMWDEEGHVQADPEEAEARLACARAEWEVESRVEWMHPLDCFAVKLAWCESEEHMPADVRLDYFDAMRTSVGLSDRDRAKWAAQAMGMGASQIRLYGEAPRREQDQDGPTALYRHYDTDGTLLYVGITHDPDERRRMHARQSAWFPHSARCDLEWHEDRRAALRAETAAIRTERPLFNVANSVVDPQLGVDYLASR